MAGYWQVCLHEYQGQSLVQNMVIKMQQEQGQHPGIFDKTILLANE